MILFVDPRVKYFWKQHKTLILLLAVSWCLRVVLVLQGGQLYWPDEHRYFRSGGFLSSLAHADLGGALDFIVQTPAHTGFVLVGSLPAVVQYATKLLLGLSAEDTIWIPALFLSLASVGCIGLAYTVARKAGADKREGLMAAFMVASATSIFYYSRHLLPYDSSMALVLLALWIGLDVRPSVWRSIIVGIVAGLAFLTYNGYWACVLTVIAIHVLHGKQSAAEVIKRGIAVGLGLVILPALLTIASIARSTTPFVVAMVQFSNTVMQGDFAEGWSLTWEYLWHAEHGLMLVWGMGAGVVAWLSVRHCRPVCSRGLLWLTAAVTICLLLSVSSTGLGKFVVYGRFARQIVPFLCLMTAYSAPYLASSRWLKGRLRPLAIIVLIAQATFNFAQPLAQQFPTDVLRQVEVAYGHIAQDVTIQGPKVLGSDEINQPSRYVLLNAQHLYPVRGPKAPPVGEVVFSIAHPLQFIPYQYEGYKPEERAILRSTDISMRLVDTQVAQQNDARSSGDP